MRATKVSTSLKAEVAALKRRRILEVATDLFYDSGYENTTLEEVADRLKVTKPFIYSHYSSKARLLADICELGIACSLAEINKVLPSSVGPEQKLRLFGEGFVLAVIGSQKQLAIYNREEKNLEPEDVQRIGRMRREFDRKLNVLLDEGVARGVFRIEDRELATLAIGGMVSWASVWYRPRGRLAPDTLATRITNLIFNVVRCDDARAPDRARTAPKQR